MKKLIIVIGLPLVIFGIIILLHKNPQQPLKEIQTSFKESFKEADNPMLIKKSISEVDSLIEIPNKAQAKVFQIKDLKTIQARSNIFKKAYKDDLVILLPDETIIYDPSTKTVRDISKETFYNEVNN